MESTDDAADRSSDGRSPTREPRTGRTDGSQSGPGSGDAPDPAEAPAPPGPDGLPVVGNTVGVVRDGLAFGARLRPYGDVVQYEAWGRRFVAVFDPALVEEVLVSRNEAFRKGEFEQSFGDLLAPAGLAFTEGERWRRQRQLLQPAFTPERVRAHADAMVDRMAAAAEGWGDGTVVDLRAECSSLTLAILAGTLFDVDLDGERGRVVRDATAALADRMDLGLAAQFLPAWAPRTPTERRFDRAMAALDDLVADLVAERRGALDEHDDLLATLLDAEYPDGTTIDPETVRDQVVTFLFAGHETTALALTYAVWLLAGHPGVRARLDAELSDVVGDRDPTFADLPDLAVTGRVVDEALRLYPPAFSLYRQPHATTTLGGYRVPADATVHLSTYDVHRDERWWDDPDAFRPERWCADRDRPEYAYVPFGGGPRHCIGMRFARTELRLALATLARRLAFERVTESLDPTPAATLDPGTVRMRVRRRG